MDLKFELVHDEPGFFRDVRIGVWRHVLDYETGQGEWYYEGVAAWTKTTYEIKTGRNLFRQPRKPNSSKKKTAA